MVVLSWMMVPFFSGGCQVQQGEAKIRRNARGDGSARQFWDVTLIFSNISDLQV